MTTSNVTAICTAITAVLAFAMSIYQSYSQRRHDRLSVTPKIDWTDDRVIGKPVRLLISNVGLGPAIIESMTISFDGKEFVIGSHGMPDELSQMLLASAQYLECHMLGPGTTIKAGSDIQLLCFPTSSSSLQSHNQAVATLSRMGFRVVYRSIYKEMYFEERAAGRNAG